MRAGAGRTGHPGTDAGELHFIHRGGSSSLKRRCLQAAERPIEDFIAVAIAEIEINLDGWRHVSQPAGMLVRSNARSTEAKISSNRLAPPPS